MKTKTILIAILIIALSSSFTIGAAVTPRISAALRGEAGYWDTEGIPGLYYGAGLMAAPGFDFNEEWGMSFPISVSVDAEMKGLHTFLSIPLHTRFSIGVGADWNLGRWLLSLSENADYTLLRDNGYLSFSTSFFPRFVLIPVEELHIGYAVGIPMNVSYGPSGFSATVGVSLSMEIGDFI